MDRMTEKIRIIALAAAAIACISGIASGTDMTAQAALRMAEAEYASQTAGSRTIELSYNDAWFLTKDSAELSPEIARVCGGGTAAFGSGADNAAAFLESAGYTHIECGYSAWAGRMKGSGGAEMAEESTSEGETGQSTAGDTAHGGRGSETDNDHASYCLGYRALKMNGKRYDLIAVLVSGYSLGGYEWNSNLNIGSGKEHRGFSLAAGELYGCIQDYISRNCRLDAQLRLWITGHSRGAAIANLAAVRLNEAYGSSNVFCYTFACPAVRVMDGNEAQNAQNIFNCINENDLVPCVPPLAWGFRRYGRDITFSRRYALKDGLFLPGTVALSRDEIADLVEAIPDRETADTVLSRSGKQGMDETGETEETEETEEAEETEETEETEKTEGSGGVAPEEFALALAGEEETRKLAELLAIGSVGGQLAAGHSMDVYLAELGL